MVVVVAVVDFLSISEPGTDQMVMLWFASFVSGLDTLRTGVIGDGKKA